jgi:hypothetical protein
MKRHALFTLLAALLLALAAPWAAAQQRNCSQAGPGLGWTLQHFAPQATQFTAHFVVTPSREDADSLVGLGAGTPGTAAQFATLLRFNAQGRIDVRDGGAFIAPKPRLYHAGVHYRVRMDVDLASRTWSVWVKEVGTQRPRPFVLVAEHLAFGPDTATVAQLDTLGLQMGAGTAAGGGTDALQVCRLSVQAVTPLPPNADCTLIVPEAPLTAQGLATPYQLVATDPAKGACHELVAEQAAFVQAAILDPATGQISVYSPLVIDRGTTPAADPVVPVLPPQAVVAIWFGYNGDNLTLRDRRSALRDGLCVNGLGSSVFGQFAYCNAPAFFDAANAAIAKGQLVVPPLGKGVDGQDCPTTRSYWVIDQDPSDNVQTSYLNVNGRVAQATAANTARFPGALAFGNPSDEGLVSKVLGPALGCSSWSAPNLADPGKTVTALPLNELTAAKWQARPVALVPVGDPMALVDGAYNLDKLNAYRRGVNQPPARAADKAGATTTCTHLRDIAPKRLAFDATWLQRAASPATDVGNSLYTFLAARYVASYGLLDCETLTGLPVNAQLTTDANGVAVGVSFLP